MRIMYHRPRRALLTPIKKPFFFQTKDFAVLMNGCLLHFSKYFGASSRFFIRKRRNLFTEAFRLNNEWNERHEDFERFSLGTSYEWITAVQKKYIGGALARSFSFILIY